MRLLFRDLPGSVVCAVLPDLGDVLRIVVDMRKPGAMGQALLMPRNCGEGSSPLGELVDWSRPWPELAGCRCRTPSAYHLGSLRGSPAGLTGLIP